jgi:hypothetical protein
MQREGSLVGVRVTLVLEGRNYEESVCVTGVLQDALPGGFVVDGRLYNDQQIIRIEVGGVESGEDG